MCFQKGRVIAAEEDHNALHDYLARASGFVFLLDLNVSERGS